MTLALYYLMAYVSIAGPGVVESPKPFPSLEWCKHDGDLAIQAHQILSYECRPMDGQSRSAG